MSKKPVLSESMENERVEIAQTRKQRSFMFGLNKYVVQKKKKTKTIHNLIR